MKLIVKLSLFVCMLLPAPTHPFAKKILTPIKEFAQASKNFSLKVYEREIKPKTDQLKTLHLPKSSYYLLGAAWISYHFGPSTIKYFFRSRRNLSPTTQPTAVLDNKIAEKKHHALLKMIDPAKRMVFTVKTMTFIAADSAKSILKQQSLSNIHRALTNVFDAEPTTTKPFPEKALSAFEEQANKNQREILNTPFDKLSNLILYGPPGSGKTETLRAYAAKHPEVLLIEISPQISREISKLNNYYFYERDSIKRICNTLHTINAYTKKLLWYAEQHYAKDEKNRVIFVLDEADALQVSKLKPHTSKEEIKACWEKQKTSILADPWDKIVETNIKDDSLKSIREHLPRDTKQTVLDTLTMSFFFFIHPMTKTIANSEVFLDFLLAGQENAANDLMNDPMQTLNKDIKDTKKVLINAAMYYLLEPLMHNPDPRSNEFKRLFKELSERAFNITTSPFAISNKDFPYRDRIRLAVITNELFLLDPALLNKNYFGSDFSYLEYTTPTLDELQTSFTQVLKDNYLSEKEITAYLTTFAELQLSYRQIKAIIEEASKNLTAPLQIHLDLAIKRAKEAAMRKNIFKN